MAANDVQANGRTWAEDQAWEAAWWGDCTNTFAEENKQILMAHRMGLEIVAVPDRPETWPAYDLAGKSVLDIGGGPVSLLLKCVNRGPECHVVDPCRYPLWVRDRYTAAGILVSMIPAEKFPVEPLAGRDPFDEAWCYNLLQHCEDPAVIAARARSHAPVVRVFEWVGIPPCVGHPQSLTPELLNEWFGGVGTVERFNGTNGCYGTAWYGVFGG